MLSIYKAKGFVLSSVLAAVASFSFLQGAQAANSVCGERDKLAKYLSTKYKETPFAVGVVTSGKSVMELYTSPDGTWTVLMTTAKGVTCAMSAGHSFQKRDKTAFLPKS